jgi:hypothetical protein
VDEAHLITRSTPLHIICQTRNVDSSKSVIKLLLDANAHTDYTDICSRLPGDLTYQFEIQDLLRVNRKLSLKCRCAQLINSENVCYENSLSSHLIAFVRMHSRSSYYRQFGLSSW